MQICCSLPLFPIDHMLCLDWGVIYDGVSFKGRGVGTPCRLFEQFFHAFQGGILFGGIFQNLRDVIPKYGWFFQAHKGG